MTRGRRRKKRAIIDSLDSRSNFGQPHIPHETLIRRHRLLALIWVGKKERRKKVKWTKRRKKMRGSSAKPLKETSNHEPNRSTETVTHALTEARCRLPPPYSSRASSTFLGSTKRNAFFRFHCSSEAKRSVEGTKGCQTATSRRTYVQNEGKTDPRST